ncbi:uncharacterized protein LOC127470206 isoform X2 [Manacus candei]|uniref:uncharacterized protein LOC127470206 isoform X2 n=1 Tax=Manacus candei TaxID=415023 RepID=UPI002228045C|nr:uncharacterized protein LOC127470206 isoform X2 [Manacus candei]XP_051641407.1 uncharacterized protein LOC127470206 isoform X2 [Manacus candei]
MSHSCAEPGSLSSRMSSATMSPRSPFLLLGEHEVDGEDPQPSAGKRDWHNCDFSPALSRWTFRVPWGITPVSSKVLTEVAAAVVPVVWASGVPEEWKRAEPCPSVPAWLFVALQAEEPRPEMAECWCDPEWVSLPLGQSPELPLASPAEGWELPRASSIQLEDPGGCSSVFLGGKRWGCRSWQECFAGRGRAGAGELQVQQLCQCWMESGWERALSVRAGESPGWPWEPWGCEQVQWAKEWALESWANSWSSSKENQETGIREQQLPVCVCRTRCTAAPSEVGNEPQEAGNESYKLVKVGWTLPKCLKSCSSVLLY